MTLAVPPPEEGHTGGPPLGESRQANKKVLAAPLLPGEPFHPPMVKDRRGAPPADGLPCLGVVPPEARSRVLPGRAGRRPDRTVAVRELPGTRLRVCSIPRRRRPGRRPRRRGNLRGPPDSRRAGIDGSPAEPSPRRSG